MCALMFTNINAFKLNLILNENKVFLSAKGGDIATKDITIPAGNTWHYSWPGIIRIQGIKCSD